MNKRIEKHHWFGWVCLVLLLVVAALIILNREWIYDFYRGITYQPSSDMVRIRSDLALTNQGEFLFNASQPELNKAEEFNNYCRGDVSETAVLGCYRNNNIYIYNITDARLDGIRELTSAHELLHAKWARMNDDEKKALAEPLTRVFEANQEFLGDEINQYDTSEKHEELYVRAGTEVADLPEVLEKHYAEVFKDQDKVVSYYNKYINVFRSLEKEMNDLKTEMGAISTEINEKTAEYSNRVEQLNVSINSFNSCANTAGCFATNTEFYMRRAELVAEQGVLDAMYAEISGLIDSYNTKVEMYNADVLKSENLNTIINSATKPSEIK